MYIKINGKKETLKIVKVRIKYVIKIIPKIIIRFFINIDNKAAIISVMTGMVIIINVISLKKTCIMYCNILFLPCFNI